MKDGLRRQWEPELPNAMAAPGLLGDRVLPHHGPLATGRARLPEVFRRTRRSLVISRVRNKGPGNADRDAIAFEPCRYQELARVALLQRLFIAIGDFNIQDEPPASHLEPAPISFSAPAGGHRQQAHWRRVFWGNDGSGE